MAGFILLLLLLPEPGERLLALGQPCDAPRGRRARPRLILLADSDAESSSAGSSDEEDVTTAEPMGAPGERVPPPGTEG